MLAAHGLVRTVVGAGNTGNRATSIDNERLRLAIRAKLDIHIKVLQVDAVALQCGGLQMHVD